MQIISLVANVVKAFVRHKLDPDQEPAPLAPTIAGRWLSAIQQSNLYGVLLLCFVLSMLSLVLALVGNVRLICGFGIVALLLLFYRFCLVRRQFLEADASLGYGSVAEWLQLSAMAACAKWLYDLDVHFAGGAIHGFWDGLRTFSWTSEALIGLVFLVCAWAALTGQVHPFARRIVRMIQSLGLFEAVFSLYILLNGFLWGAAPLRAADTILHPALNGIWPVTTVYHQAAGTLYHAQGKNLFYAVFVVFPLFCLYSARWKTRVVWRALASHACLACLLMLWLAVCLAYRSGDMGRGIGWCVYDVLNWGYPIDKHLYDCMRPIQWEGKPDTAATGCYLAAAQEWQKELKQSRSLLLKRADKKEALSFRKNDARWEHQVKSDEARREKNLKSNPKKTYFLVTARWQALRDRTMFLNACLHDFNHVTFR